MNGYLNILAEYERTAGAGAPALRCAAPDQIFGPLSQRAAGADAAAAVTHAAGGFSSTELFHAAAVVLLVCYVLVLYRHPELLRSLREHLFSSGAGRDEHLNDNRNDPLRGFSWGRMLLDTLFFSTAVVRLVDLAAPDAAAAVPPPARMLALPLAAALFGLTVAYQYSLLALSGAVTVSRPLTSTLAHLKTVYYRLVTVALTPLLLLWVLCPEGSGATFGIIIAMVLAAMVAIFMRETFLLFVSKKLSIFHWILYLCAVEAFPLSLVCLAAARG